MNGRMTPILSHEKFKQNRFATPPTPFRTITEGSEASLLRIRKWDAASRTRIRAIIVNFPSLGGVEDERRGTRNKFTDSRHDALECRAGTYILRLTQVHAATLMQGNLV